MEAPNLAPQEEKPLKKVSLKVVLLGESGVGKSSLAHRFAHNKFSEFYEATVGAGYFEKNVTTDTHCFNVCIWDTAGQERFASLAAFYYRGTQIALVVFDISKKPTFERAKAWISELHANAPANVIVYLVGNKSDLSQREVITDEAMSYAKDLGLLYIEVSAKTNENVNELFMDSIRHVPLESLTPVVTNAVVLQQKESAGEEVAKKYACAC